MAFFLTKVLFTINIQYIDYSSVMGEKYYNVNLFQLFDSELIFYLTYSSWTVKRLT